MGLGTGCGCYYGTSTNSDVTACSCTSQLERRGETVFFVAGIVINCRVYCDLLRGARRRGRDVARNWRDSRAITTIEEKSLALQSRPSFFCIELVRK